MTDYSKMTDEQVNEAIAVKKGWRHHAYIDEYGGHDDWKTPAGRPSIFGRHPDYTHDWRLAGELLEEMKDKCLVSLMNGRLDNPHWVCGIFANPRVISTNASTPQRAICEAWLAWKEKS